MKAAINARVSTQVLPIWLQLAFSDWVGSRVYLDGRGNYRSRVPGRPIVSYNRPLKRLYPDNQEFHRAAHLWLGLWEAVPTAGLASAEGMRTTALQRLRTEGGAR